MTPRSYSRRIRTADGEQDQDEDGDDGDDREGDCPSNWLLRPASSSDLGERADEQRQPVDRLDPDSSAALAQPLGVALRPPSASVARHSAPSTKTWPTGLERRRAPRRPRPAAPPSRSATGLRLASTTFWTANAEQPPSTTRHRSRPATETSNASESVSNSSSPEATSAHDPATPSIPSVGRCASAMISATPTTSSTMPDRGHRQLRGAEGAEQQRDRRRPRRGRSAPG